MESNVTSTGNFVFLKKCIEPADEAGFFFICNCTLYQICTTADTETCQKAHLQFVHNKLMEVPVNIKDILKQNAYRNIPLGYDDAYELGCVAVEACVEGAEPLIRIQTIIALSALHNKATYSYVGDGISTPKNAAEQIAGICAAVFNEDIAKSKFGFAKPNVSLAMDNCGMGGDLIVTANVSTISAFIAAAAGIPMCKHGSPAQADKGRHGSSDFIGLCGIDPYASRNDVEKSVESCNFGYTEALDTRFKLIHLQTHTYAELPHMNDIIGPITNPVDPKIMTRRVIGVNHLMSPALVTEAYKIMNQKGVTSMENLIVVRGFAQKGSVVGMDELSICPGGTEVAELLRGEITVKKVGAEEFGLQSVDPVDISPPKGVSKGDFSMQILHGEIQGPALDMVLANAALLFALADDTLTYREAYKAARDTFESRRVPDVVESVKDMLSCAA